MASAAWTFSSFSACTFFSSCTRAPSSRARCRHRLSPEGSWAETWGEGVVSVRVTGACHSPQRFGCLTWILEPATGAAFLAFLRGEEGCGSSGAAGGSPGSGICGWEGRNFLSKARVARALQSDAPNPTSHSQLPSGAAPHPGPKAGPAAWLGPISPNATSLFPGFPHARSPRRPAAAASCARVAWAARAWARRPGGRACGCCPGCRAPP